MDRVQLSLAGDDFACFLLGLIALGRQFSLVLQPTPEKEMDGRANPKEDEPEPIPLLDLLR